MFKSYEKEGNLGLRVTFYASFLTATAPKEHTIDVGDCEAGPCLSQQPWNQLQKFITILFIIIFTIIFIIYSSGVRGIHNDSILILQSSWLSLELT